MTNYEFDNAEFRCTDEIEVRKYFGREKEHVEWVNFNRREVNGYRPSEIIRHIKTKEPMQEKKNDGYTLNKDPKINFENSVDAYVKTLLYMWSDYVDEDPAFSPFYGHWAGDDKAGIYCYEDVFSISLSDIIYCVENSIGYRDYAKWQEYCIEAAEWGFTTPNLRAWMDCCPRVSEDTFERLRQQKAQLQRMVEEEKERIGC